jgi:hypothetical protein
MRVARPMRTMRLRIRWIAVPSLVALALAGCARQEPPANGPGDMPLPNMGDAGDAAAVTMLQRASGAPSASPVDLSTATVSNGSAMNDDLKAYLTRFQAKVGAQLQQAQTLQGELDLEVRAGPEGGGT